MTIAKSGSEVVTTIHDCEGLTGVEFEAGTYTYDFLVESSGALAANSSIEIEATTWTSKHIPTASHLS